MTRPAPTGDEMIREYLEQGLRRQVAVQKKVTPRMLTDILGSLVDLAKGICVNKKVTLKSGVVRDGYYERAPDVKAIMALYRLAGCDATLQPAVELNIAKAQREIAQMTLAPLQAEFYRAQSERARTETGAYSMTLVTPENIEACMLHYSAAIVGFFLKIPIEEMREYTRSDGDLQRLHVRLQQFSEKTLASVLDELRASSLPPAVGDVQNLVREDEDEG